eukprot:2042152-Prymnesium_polylepis.1
MRALLSVVVQRRRRSRRADPRLKRRRRPVGGERHQRVERAQVAVRLARAIAQIAAVVEGGRRVVQH